MRSREGVAGGPNLWQGHAMTLVITLFPSLPNGAGFVEGGRGNVAGPQGTGSRNGPGTAIVVWRSITGR